MFINLEYSLDGQFFVQIKLVKFQNNMEISLKIMKKYLEIY